MIQNHVLTAASVHFNSDALSGNPGALGEESEGTDFFGTLLKNYICFVCLYVS
jgi:hypothetical protein